MEIIRGNQLDDILIGDLNPGQVFEYKDLIGIVTNRKKLSITIIVYLNSGAVDELEPSTKVQVRKATVQVYY